MARYSLTQQSRSNLDHGTLLGIVASFGLVAVSIMIGGGLTMFFDLGSALLVLGGTLGATLINFPLEDFKNTLTILRPVIFPDETSATGRIRHLIALAQKARTEGKLALQDELYRERDPFLRKCVELLVDDIPPADVRRILEMELVLLGDRHRRGAELFQAMGASAPAMGLIGTLVGLVQMLQHLNDPKAIGPAMALALLTTFYGAILAYVLFLPIAGKLRRRSEEEALIKEMTIEGINGILQGTNPRLIEQHLFGFLPTDQRISQYR